MQLFLCMLLTSYLKPDLTKNNNITTLICLAISVRAKVLHDPLVQYSRGLNLYGNIDKLAVLVRGGAVLKRCLILAVQVGMANHNALGQLTNHNKFNFSEGGPWTNRVICVMLGRERGIVIKGINRMVRHDSISIFKPSNTIKCIFRYATEM